MKRRNVITALSILTTTACLHAVEWSLQQCIDYAIEHNIQIKQQEQQVENGLLQVSDSKHAFLPQVNGSISQSFNFGRGLTASNTYANRNTSNFQAGLSFSVPLFSGLRNYRTLQQSKLNLQQIMYQVEQSRDNITLNLIAQYLQVLYSKEVEATAKNQVDLSTYELNRRKSLAEAGKIAEVEVLEAESQLANDQLTQVNAHNDYQLALLELTQLLQLESYDDFEVVEIEGDDPVIPSAMLVYNDAMYNNNGIKSANANIDVARAGISVAQTGYIPTLSFSGGVGSSYFKLNGVDNLPFKKQMKENYSTYIGFSLNIPIFDALNTRNSVKRARVQLRTAQLQYDQVKSDLYKSIQQAHVQATGAADKYVTATKSCESASISFEAMCEKYNIGRATATEYEQSKTNLFNARIQQIQSHYEYLLRYRILDFYRYNRYR